jgi:hypothetical protein
VSCARRAWTVVALLAVVAVFAQGKVAPEFFELDLQWASLLAAVACALTTCSTAGRRRAARFAPVGVRDAALDGRLGTGRRVCGRLRTA